VHRHHHHQVGILFQDDEIRSEKHLLPPLLAKYKMLLYSGQFDINVGAPGTELLLNTLAWPGLEDYRSAKRQIWRVRLTESQHCISGARSHRVASLVVEQLAGDVVGYAKQARSLTYVLVNGAGHMVPATQPASALDMINRFINNLPFS